MMQGDDYLQLGERQCDYADDTAFLAEMLDIFNDALTSFSLEAKSWDYKLAGLRQNCNLSALTWIHQTL